MSLLQRATKDIEQRGHWRGPFNLKDPELSRLFSDGPRVSSGVHVTEDTALNLSAVWAAVQVYTGHVGSLPLLTYRRTKDGGKQRDASNSLYTLLHDQPNPEMSAMVFRETLQAHALTWGNGYSEIVRNGLGLPVALWPITPNRVRPDRDNAGRLFYRVDGNTNIPADDMLHIPGLGFDGVSGYSVVSKARESIGLGLAAEKFGATFYGNGSTFGGVLTTENTLNDPQVATVRKNIEGFHQGVDRAHRFMVLSGGFTYERLGVPPEDAQFLESRAFQVTEIARWFNLPPHKLRDLQRATFSNIEAQSIEFVTDSLVPWLKRWEQELNRKLIPRSSRADVFCEFLVDGLLRGDAQSRGDYYSKMVHLGAMSINEVRARENLNPIPGGDVHFVSTNLQPIDRAVAVGPTVSDRPAPERDLTDLFVAVSERGARRALNGHTTPYRDPYLEDSRHGD